MEILQHPGSTGRVLPEAELRLDDVLWTDPPVRFRWKVRRLLERSGRLPYFVLPRLLAPLGLIEARRLRSIPADFPVLPAPVVIVGAPRTGSTAYFQAVTNTFRVGYLSSLAAYFPHSPSLGFDLQRLLFGEGAHDCFRSRHGRGPGPRAPSETGKLWHRWFPRDRDYAAAGDVPQVRARDLRRTIGLLTRRARATFVFKNLPCGQRLQAISEILPEALIVFIQRHPLDTALSLLRVREAVHGRRTRWVSVRPRDHRALLGLPWPAQIVRQVHSLERRICRDLRLFPPRQVLRVRYESFCEDPRGEMARFEALLAANGGAPARRQEASSPMIIPSRPPHDGAEARLLRAEIDRLDWGGPGVDGYD